MECLRESIGVFEDESTLEVFRTHDVRIVFARNVQNECAGLGDSEPACQINVTCGALTDIGPPVNKVSLFSPSWPYRGPYKQGFLQACQPTRMKRMNHPNNPFSS